MPKKMRETISSRLLGLYNTVKESLSKQSPQIEKKRIDIRMDQNEEKVEKAWNRILSFDDVSLEPYYPKKRRPDVQIWTNDIVMYAHCVLNNLEAYKPMVALHGQEVPMSRELLETEMPELVTAIKAIEAAEQSRYKETVTIFGMDACIMEALTDLDSQNMATMKTNNQQRKIVKNKKSLDFKVLLETPKVTPWITNAEVNSLNQNAKESEQDKQNRKDVLQEPFAQDVFKQSARMKAASETFTEYVNNYEIISGTHTVETENKQALDHFIERNPSLIPQGLYVTIYREESSETLALNDIENREKIIHNDQTTPEAQVKTDVCSNLVQERQALYEKTCEKKVTPGNYNHQDARAAMKDHYNTRIDTVRDQIADQLSKRRDWKGAWDESHKKKRNVRIEALKDEIDSMKIKDDAPMDHRLASLHLEFLNNIAKNNQQEIYQTKEVRQAIEHHFKRPIVQKMKAKNSVTCLQ